MLADEEQAALEAVNPEIHPKKKRKSGPSMKVFCPAKFYIRRRIDNNHFEVEWFWKHEGHDPFSLAEMKRMRLAKSVEEWLSERVLDGMKWPAIKRLLYAPDLFPVSKFLFLVELILLTLCTINRKIQKTQLWFPNFSQYLIKKWPMQCENGLMKWFILIRMLSIRLRPGPKNFKMMAGM